MRLFSNISLDLPSQGRGTKGEGCKISVGEVKMLKQLKQNRTYLSAIDVILFSSDVRSCVSF